MAYVFGPVPSRRLGLSLGIDLTPRKSCSLSCVYCQIGPTPAATVNRRAYVPVDEVIEDLAGVLERRRPDWITFSGSGEPTLHDGLGDIIRRIRELTDVPVCVITNGTLMDQSAVRADLSLADAVMPSLDSAVETTFRRLCRPHASIRLDAVIEGMATFRASYAGALWLETLFVRGVNDTSDEVDALVRAVERIRPDRMYLNTVVRPPAERNVIPMAREDLEAIRCRFGDRAEVIAAFNERESTGDVDPERILESLRRHPATASEVASSLGAGRDRVEAVLECLADEGRVRRNEFEGTTFWEYH